MSEQIKEQLSAYLDDELALEQFSQLDKHISGDSELRKTLNRYALISETMKGNHGVCNAAGIADTVSKALENEPVILAPHLKNRNKGGHWKTYIGGGAIAATVAALAVLNIGTLQQDLSTGTEQFPVTVDVQSLSPALPVSMATGYTQKASTTWSMDNGSKPEYEDELNQFLIDHSEFTTQTGVPGLLPYATFVVYDKK